MNMRVTTQLLLEARGLRVGYGSFEVIKGIDLAVAGGETLAVIGPNGAGKTTLFKALTGEVMAKGGTVSFAGEDVTGLPAHERTGKGMGRTFQVSRVFLEHTALENVVTALEARHRNAGEIYSKWWAWRPSRAIVAEARDTLDQLGIAHLANRVAGTISHGDKKRLELALTLALHPKILMLDEPTAGMAPADRMQIVELIQRIRNDRGVAVVMTEHDMDVIFNLADRVMVMNYGEMIATGSVEEVRQNPMVREVYLGQEMYSAEH